DKIKAEASMGKAPRSPMKEPFP
ncbi:hypothetical protein A2U01_0112476, partial [Trifolium medium]|nr:hypothetical protein [Trifolium medium]